MDEDRLARLQKAGERGIATGGPAWLTSEQGAPETALLGLLAYPVYQFASGRGSAFLLLKRSKT